MKNLKEVTKHSTLDRITTEEAIDLVKSTFQKELCSQLHLKKVGAKLTKLTQKQADYIGVDINGPSASIEIRLFTRFGTAPA